jgi:hypothetical protein
MQNKQAAPLPDRPQAAVITARWGRDTHAVAAGSWAGAAGRRRRPSGPGGPLSRPQTAMSIVEGEFADIPEREIIQVMRFAFPFRNFSMDVIRRTARAAIPIQYEAGDIIVRQDEEGDSMFLLISGSVYITTDLGELATAPSRRKQLRFLYKGNTFGENAIVWDEEESNLWKSYHVREFQAIAEDYSIVVEFSRNVMQPVSFPVNFIGEAAFHMK